MSLLSGRHRYLSLHVLVTALRRSLTPPSTISCLLLKALMPELSRAPRAAPHFHLTFHSKASSMSFLPYKQLCCLPYDPLLGLLIPRSLLWFFQTLLLYDNNIQTLVSERQSYIPHHLFAKEHNRPPHCGNNHYHPLTCGRAHQSTIITLTRNIRTLKLISTSTKHPSTSAFESPTPPANDITSKLHDASRFQALDRRQRCGPWPP